MIVLALSSLFFSPVHAQELLNYPLDTVNGEEVYRYTVERSIGLYRVGVNFDVPQSEIIRLNPQLRERGLHYGETLLIPTKRPVLKKEVKIEKAEIADKKFEKVEKVEKTEKAEKADTVVTVVTEIAVPDTVPQDTVAADTILPDTRRVIELALMLPFESKQMKRSGNAERMMEFYQGALLALRDSQNDSTLYRLRVYDTERSELRVTELCDSTELDSVQGVIGLVYPIQIERMAIWCDAHQVPLLLPFSDDITLEQHPSVMQFNSTDTQEADSLCRWIMSHDVHCAALETREVDLAPTIRLLRRQLKAQGVSISGIGMFDLIKDSIAYALDREKENLIIFHSDRFQHVRLLLPHIAKLQEEGYRIRIVSQYSWQKENIDLPQIYTSMFTATADRQSYDEAWQQSYVGEHVSETPRYDLLGYDLTRAMLHWLQGEKEIQGLQSDIHWTQVRNGGWQNAYVTVVEK